jgi:hypothetical protein
LDRLTRGCPDVRRVLASAAFVSRCREINTSFASLLVFFEELPAHEITPGGVEDYKATWRDSSC